jgi:hypothetical protein
MKTALFAALVGASLLPAAAPADDAPPRINVTAVHNEAELTYPGFLRSFAKLNALLPPEPRHVDLLHRIRFTRLNPVEQDGFTSPTWAISIVSRTRDIEVPIVRGGYFLLPIDRVAMQENARIIFNTHTSDGVLGLALEMRRHAGDVIHAADLAAAFAEANQFHTEASKTPIYHGPGNFNAIKACFKTQSGDMIVIHGGGVKSSLGMCQLYVPADGDVEANTDIAFSVEPDIVVLESVRHQASINAPD